MAAYKPPTDEEREKLRIAHFEKARKGVLAFVHENGGEQPMGSMHDFSLKKFFIQHEVFSNLMESLVDEKLVDYDHGTQIAVITEEGKKYISV